MERERTSSAGWSTEQRLRALLYLISMLSDFASFIIVFSVSRSLADQNVGPTYLGIVGAGFSFCAGTGAILSGYLSGKFDGRVVFLTGTSCVVAGGLACSDLTPQSKAFLLAYWVLGLGMGILYPPLIGWLNQDQDAHVNRSGVNRRLILFCVSWNLGMMLGQLLGGNLLERGSSLTLRIGLGVACVNLLFSILAVRFVRPIRPVVILGEPISSERSDTASTFKRLGWIANLGGVFGGAMVIHLMPDLMVSIGIEAESHGELLASWRGVIIASYLVMYLFSFWHFRFSVSVISQLLGASGLFVIALAESNSMLLLGLALQGQLVGFNYYSGLFYSTAGSKQEGRALAAGIHEATLATGMALGTIAGGGLGSLAGTRAPYWMAGGFILVLVVVQLAARQLWKRAKEQSRDLPEESGSLSSKSDPAP